MGEQRYICPVFPTWERGVICPVCDYMGEQRYICPVFPTWERGGISPV